MPLIALLSVLLERPRIMLGVPVGLALLAVLVATIRGPAYEAEALVQPQSRQTPMLAGLLGAAAQSGINFGSLGQGSDPLDFYPRLLGSDELLRDAVRTRYTFSTHDLNRTEGDTLTGTLVELHDESGPTEEARMRNAVRRLRRSVTTRVDPMAGTFTLLVEQPWPELAVQVNRRLLELVNEYNLEKRQSQATEEAKFIDGRLAEVRADLERAEDQLARFLAANRRYQDDPHLTFEHDRLQRRVTLHQSLYTSLAQSLDQARNDAVRNTPVMTVVAPPEGTARKATSRLLYAVVAFGIGLLLAVSLVFFLSHLDHQRTEHPAEFERLSRLTRLARRRLLPTPSRGPDAH